MAIIELPDFDMLFQLALDIKNLSVKEGLLELEIKRSESDIIRHAVEGSQGKPPSMAYLQSTIAFTGVDGSLYNLRKELVEVSSELDYKKLLLDLYKRMIDVWRTQSANERIVVS
jgi:hypothetical protein